MTKKLHTALASLTLLATGIALLSGCSSANQLLNIPTTNEYADRAELAASTDPTPTWVPDDSTEITVVTPASPDSDIVVMLVMSDASLPDTCVEVERRSAPQLTVDGAPDAYDAETVSVCGEWSVIASDSGWYGWTPNSGDRADLPSP